MKFTPIQIALSAGLALAAVMAYSKTSGAESAANTPQPTPAPVENYSTRIDVTGGNSATRLQAVETLFPEPRRHGSVIRNSSNTEISLHSPSPLMVDVGSNGFTTFTDGVHQIRVRRSLRIQ